MITQRQARIDLKQAIAADLTGLQEAVAQTLERAFRYREENLELGFMLGALVEHLGEQGLPRVHEVEEDLNAREFWSALTGEPIPWDPYGGDEKNARGDWKLEVAEGGTELGFHAWWDDKIETARHDL